MKFKLLLTGLLLTISACESTLRVVASNDTVAQTLTSLEFSTAPVASNTDSIFSTQPVITAYDSSGAIFTSDSTITLTAYDTAACAGNVISSALGGTTAVSLASGIASFTDVKPLKVSIKSLKASSGSISVCSNTLSVAAGAPASIVFSSGDAQIASVGAPLVSPLVALVKDAHNNLVPGATVNWAVTVGNGTLSACTATDASGLSQCSFTLGTTVGTNTITATIPGPFAPASFSAIGTIEALSLAQSAMTISSNSIVSNATATLTITLRDTYGNQIPDASKASDLSITVLTSGTSTGTVSAITAISGNAGAYQATLTGIIAGTANTIKATIYSSDFTSVKPSFTVTVGAAAKLAFVQQPSSTMAGFAITPAVTVIAQDINGNNLTTYASNIVMAIDPGNNPAVGTLSGTLTRTPASGVATFNDLSINNVGVGYALRATSGSLIPAVSSAFPIVTPIFITASTTDTDSTTIALGGVHKTLDVKVFSTATYPSTVGFVGQFSSLSADGYNTCGVATNGQHKCWGSNAQVFTSNSFSSLASRSPWGMICGINPSGDLYCWGYTPWVSLGDGTTGSSSSPILIDSGTKYLHVSNGWGHSCAITVAGDLKCWGINWWGQLGNNGGGDQSTPVVIDAGTKYASISTGYFGSTCGITINHVLKCWGYGYSGQVVPGNNNLFNTPQTIGSNYTSVSTGYNHTCAITTSGDLQCWGSNGNGELGDGTTNSLSSLFTVGSGYASVSAGQNHTCALTSGGELKCWGYNGSGQIGDGTTTLRNAPFTVGTGYSAVAVGSSHSCGLTTGGTIKCWGYGANGQLGDGTAMNLLSPPSVALNSGSCTIDSNDNDQSVSNVVCACNGVSCFLQYDTYNNNVGSANITYTVVDGTGLHSAQGAITVNVDHLYGCTDGNAKNYNGNADVDDGSCIAWIYGCMDSSALNFNSSAEQDDGSCTYKQGCTDGNALNYDPTAMQDDGSCTYVYGCTDANALNYDSSATMNDGSCTYKQGCTDSSASNYDPSAMQNDGSCQYLNTGIDKRSYHSSTLLASGKVLISGGGNAVGNVTNHAALFDPATGKLTAGGNMSTPRYLHTASLLSNGKVLIAAGNDNSLTQLASAELYDPTTGTFTATGSLGTPRQGHTATVLNNGKVLITGGWYNTGSIASAELYDPATGTFTAPGNMTTIRRAHTATLLPNGKVLITGGYGGPSPLASAELYDPATGTFTATGSLITARFFQTAILLSTGKVLIVAGHNTARVASSELYDPATGTFTATGSVITARAGHTLSTLANGKILVVGGSDNTGWAIYQSELYDPATGLFTAAANTVVRRSAHSASVLTNGKVLIVGGSNENGMTSSAELYDPGSNSFSATGT